MKKSKRGHWQLDRVLPGGYFEDIRNEKISEYGGGTPEQIHVKRMLLNGTSHLLDEYPYCDHIVYCIHDAIKKSLLRYRVYPDGMVMKEIIPTA